MEIKMEEKAVTRLRTRASAPRVRTGCKTCKIRRVKCDEAKPSCNRCIKFGVICDGYGTKKPNSHQPAVPTRTLIPRATFPLTASPSQNLFDLDNPEEWTYFQRFCNYTVGRLSGLRESELWSRIVLQATQAEPSIRHAATAIGALDLKSYTSAGDESIKFRKQFAYKEYQKAIVGMRKTLAAKGGDTRMRLVACILFACFEAYHGNYETARTQIISGIEMMEEHTKKRKEAAMNGPPIDPELVQAFALLEIQASAWCDTRPGELHLERMYNCADVVENGMPFEFSGIKQAGMILSFNMLRGIHLRFSQTNSAILEEGTVIPPFVGLAPCVNESAVYELNRILASFKAWSAAFEPLYRKARSAAGEKIFESATMLRMHYLGSVAWVASGSPSIEMYYRRYTKELKEIVALGRILVDLTDTESFSLDMRFVLPLAVVGLNYRHRALRQECIQILTPMYRREAIWDASMMGKVMKFQAEIEEEGLGDEDEYVPEDGMSTITYLNVDESLRTVFITCSVGVRGHPGESMIKSTKLVW
ncbi:hypothetical protein N431DRAFT_348684 [Stipitochalara longipes BDJ]|nr:hypothetical protein N431DRAFT_348684 [Stipitochalara longipes BDJ]